MVTDLTTENTNLTNDDSDLASQLETGESLEHADNEASESEDSSSDEVEPKKEAYVSQESFNQTMGVLREKSRVKMDSLRQQSEEKNKAYEKIIQDLMSKGDQDYYDPDDSEEAPAQLSEEKIGKIIGSALDERENAKMVSNANSNGLRKYDDWSETVSEIVEDSNYDKDLQHLVGTALHMKNGEDLVYQLAKDPELASKISQYKPRLMESTLRKMLSKPATKKFEKQTKRMANPPIGDLRTSPVNTGSTKQLTSSEKRAVARARLEKYKR